MRVWFITTK